MSCASFKPKAKGNIMSTQKAGEERYKVCRVALLNQRPKKKEHFFSGPLPFQA